MSDGSYYVSDIQDYFEYIIKKHETIPDNPPVQIYVNKIKNRIVFKIKAGYKLELLPEETMQLLGSSKKVIDKSKDGEITNMEKRILVTGQPNRGGSPINARFK